MKIDHTATHRVPKLCGADVELGNFVDGVPSSDGTGDEASRALVREIRGFPRSSTLPPLSYTASRWFGFKSVSGFNPQDYARRYLARTGGCIYIDQKHAELCLPEVLSAFDHLAAWHAHLRIVRKAQVKASARLPEGQSVKVLVNNSDGKGHTYGSHLDFLITRRCFDNLFRYKYLHTLFFASYLTSSIVITGAGKVQSENRAPRVDYQIAQRADFYEDFCGPQTTYNRPIVNSRDESLCGRNALLARLHVIFFDNTLCHVSSLLKVGVTQIVLAMLEQEYLSPGLIVENPILAVRRWSHDPELKARARVASGRRLTAVELQFALLELAGKFVDAGRVEGIVPRAAEIVGLWAETLEELKNRDWAPLMGKLDWVLKQQVVKKLLSDAGLSWQSPEAKHYDHLYGSLDLDEGFYWIYERAGVVRRLVDEERIDWFTRNAPEDTRAWLRAKVLREIDPGAVSHVDWDEIRFKFPLSGDDLWPRYDYFTLPMPDPLGFTRARCEEAFLESATPRAALERIGWRETDWQGSYSWKEKEVQS